VITPSSSAILKTEREKQSTERISWRKGDLIGTGANGRVYLGLEEDTGAIIAVKEILFTNNQSVSA
jgi:serine/threonine protein kinase